MTNRLDLRSPREQAMLDAAPFHAWTLQNDTVWAEFYRLDRSYLLRFPCLADFLVKAGDSEVTCFPVPGLSAQTAEHLYLNQVLPLVLSRQGKLVFHASAVELAGHAVAFVGESGRGKSTLAASFALAGQPFLTDDGLVLELDGGRFSVVPTHPSIRLWEDSERALLPPSTQRAGAVSYTSKARFLASDDLVFCRHNSALGPVYFLGDKITDDVEILPLSAAEAVVEWVKHSFLLDVEDPAALAVHFDRVAALSNHTTHYRLDYPREFESLGRVRQTIVDHMGQAEEDL